MRYNPFPTIGIAVPSVQTTASSRGHAEHTFEVEAPVPLLQYPEGQFLQEELSSVLEYLPGSQATQSSVEYAAEVLSKRVFLYPKPQLSQNVPL
jgi:hypothetical protein